MIPVSRQKFIKTDLALTHGQVLKRRILHLKKLFYVKIMQKMHN